MERIGKAVVRYGEIRRQAGLPDVADKDWHGMPGLTARIRHDLYQVVRADIVGEFCRVMPEWKDNMTPDEINVFARFISNAETLLYASSMPSFADPTVNRTADDGLRFDMLTRLLATAAAPGASREFNGYLTQAIRGLMYDQLNDIPCWEYVAGRFLMGFMTKDLSLTPDGKKYMDALREMKPAPARLVRMNKTVH